MPRHSHQATPAVITASPANTSRQVATCSTASSGAEAISAPSEPEVMIQPVSEACRSAGNHCEKNLKAAIRQAETPRPISPRPTASMPMPSLTAKIAAPAAATSSSAASTRRAPKRSSSRPSGSWVEPKAMK
ncbi:MAG: hypothetical protein QM701_12150 [Propionivibrio sp.]